jgi:four helix bundle protein
MEETKKSKCRSFKDLQVWQRGIRLVKTVYDITRTYPPEEFYGLVSQTRRSAISIPSNIAEGFTRFHDKEFMQFLYVALGSCAESVTHLIIAEQLRYVSATQIEIVLQEIDEISKMIMGLIKSIKARLASTEVVGSRRRERSPKPKNPSMEPKT